MKKNLILKATALLSMLALALVIIGVPGMALADINAVTITPGGGQSYNIPVGGTVDLTAAVSGTPLGLVTYSWARSSITNISLSSDTGSTTTVRGLVPGTSTSITVTASDAGGAPTVVSTSITINVSAINHQQR